MAGTLEEKSLAGVIRAAMEARLEGIYTALPGRVVRYDAAAQVADVLPTLKRPLRRGDGSVVLEELPILPSVPVIFFSAGGFRIELPVEEGDSVLVLFTMRAHAEWRRTGEVSDPGDYRLHHLGGAVAIPGFLTETQSGAHPRNLVLGKRGGPEVHVTNEEVHLGAENPSDFVALASLVLARLEHLTERFNTHTHPTTATVGASATPGVVSMTTTPADPPASVASSMVRSR